MRTLSVNIDHVATLRQARQESFPDPVQAAVMAELAGADGITIHLRQDRRHINERDVRLLKAIAKTELNMELAATREMMRIAREVKPDQVTLVPESPAEVTTQGGLDLARNLRRIALFARPLSRDHIRLSAFVEPDSRQIEAAAQLGCDMVELNTDAYSRATARRPALLDAIHGAANHARALGLKVHAGHGIDYRNIIPLLGVPEIEGYSIGFAIVARAVLVGLREAVYEMRRTMEVYS